MLNPFLYRNSKKVKKIATSHYAKLNFFELKIDFDVSWNMKSIGFFSS